MFCLVSLLFVAAEWVWYQMFSSDWIAAYIFNSDNKAPVLHLFTGFPVQTAAIDKRARSVMPISLTFRISSFDPSSGLMQGQVQLLLGHQWFDQNSRVPNVVYVNGSPANIIRHSRTCKDCSQYATGSVRYQEVVLGTSAAFPSDKYLISGSFRLGNGGDKPISKAMRTVLEIGPGLHGYEIEALRMGKDTSHVAVLLSRPESEVIWYYAIALAPVLLIFVLLWQLVTGTRITLEAGIGILAILSLRQVLVPSNISGITRIDILLGLEVVMMIVLVAIGGFRQNVATRSRDARLEVG
jgi:hypothetical protein